MRILSNRLPLERNLLAILDALPDVVAAFDLDGRLEFINEPGARLFSAPQTKLELTILSDLYSETDGERIVAEALPYAIEHGRWSGTVSLKTGGGLFVESEQHWIARRDDSGKLTALVLVARPIQADGTLPTDPAAIELRNRRELLAFLSKGIVHDLNNVLGPIQIYSELAEKHVATDDRVRRYFENIRQASDRAQGLTERLATLGRRRVTECGPVDLAELVREVIGWLRVARPDVTIAAELPTTCAWVHGDAVQLHQVIANLGRNAVEALPDRTGTVTFGLQSAVSDRVPSVRLTVDDDGVGVEARHRMRIFEPFFTTKPGHTGLGLTVSRHIVEAHGGRLVADHPAEGGAAIALDLRVSTTD